MTHPNVTHGASCDRTITPEYAAWSGARGRCRNPNNGKYLYYGGRGITFDPRWDDFTLFLADVGSRPSPKHSLDRIDTDGNYEPGNVRWATTIEQQRNRRERITVADIMRFTTLTYEDIEWIREQKRKVV